MRIGGPARNHGVPDAAIWHGARNATRKSGMDGGLTMPTGPGPRLGTAAVRRARPAATIR
jgi:hypothetical protein